MVRRRGAEVAASDEPPPRSPGPGAGRILRKGGGGVNDTLVPGPWSGAPGHPGQRTSTCQRRRRCYAAAAVLPAPVQEVNDEAGGVHGPGSRSPDGRGRGPPGGGACRQGGRSPAGRLGNAGDGGGRGEDRGAAGRGRR